MARQISYTVSIPEPCRQGWENMTPSAKGRFCDACQKEVIDFTGLDDKEMLRIVQANLGRLCGRFRKNQLQREIFVTETYGWRFPIRKDLLLALLTFGSIQPLIAQSSFRQKEVLTESMFSSALVEDDKDTEKTVGDSLRKISGTVLTKEKNEPMAFVNIWIMNTNKIVTTNEKGKFILELDASLPQNITLKISSIGYNPLEIKLTDEEIESSRPFVFYLSEGVELGGAIITIKNKNRRKRCQ